MKKLLLVTSLLLINSCATIVSDKAYPVSFNSTPSGAKLEVVNRKGIKEFEGTTPTVFALDSGDGYFAKARYTVKMSKEGYGEQSSQITPSLDGWYWGNILFGGLIGFLIVDPLTGAMYEIDQSNVNLNLPALPTSQLSLKTN